MIVKVERLNGWRYFDNIDNIAIQTIKQEDIIVDVYSPPTQFICLTKGEKKTYYNKILDFFVKETLIFRLVIDLNEVYLMNDEGKTIERIN